MIQGIKFCPFCGTQLDYDYKTYIDNEKNKITEFKQFCKKCGWEQIDKSVTVNNIDDEYEIPIITIPNPFHIPNACRNCINHPSNGGSGFCNCTLGSEVFY